jgi:CMP/dCMP kinase
MIVTLDGPTGSGKSTVAQIIAQRLHWYHLNTGLLYRALAYILTVRYGYDYITTMPSREQVEAALVSIKYQYDQHHGPSVTVEGKDITSYLKTDAIDRAASRIAADGMVRNFLLSYQRKLAQDYALVVDGRDTGSVVFPYAEYKFFLTASPKIRAQRWRSEQLRRGSYFSEEEAEALVNERDIRDTQRALAPLVIPSGAIIIDNSLMNAEETAAALLKYIAV